MKHSEVLKLLDTMPTQAERANWSLHHPELVRVIHVFIRYDWMDDATWDTVQDHSLGMTFPIYGDDPADREEAANLKAARVAEFFGWRALDYKWIWNKLNQDTEGGGQAD